MKSSDDVVILPLQFVLRPRRAVWRRPVLWAQSDADEQIPQIKDYVINRQNRLNAPGYIARV